MEIKAEFLGLIDNKIIKLMICECSTFIYYFVEKEDLNKETYLTPIDEVDFNKAIKTLEEKVKNNISSVIIEPIATIDTTVKADELTMLIIRSYSNDTKVFMGHTTKLSIYGNKLYQKIYDEVYEILNSLQ